MDPNTAVTTNVVVALIGLTGCIVLLLFLIARWKWHVFLALLTPILLFGVLPGIQRNSFIEAFEHGFGNTLGKIGIVIVLGSMIAEALRHTGAIQVITRSMVQMIGVGEETGALDEMLNKIAIFYDDEVNTAVDTLTSVLEPIMIVVMGLVVGGMVVAMYMPMFKLVSVVSGGH